jgi:hypothetical protein
MLAATHDLAILGGVLATVAPPAEGLGSSVVDLS